MGKSEMQAKPISVCQLIKPTAYLFKYNHFHSSSQSTGRVTTMKGVVCHSMCLAVLLLFLATLSPSCAGTTGLQDQQPTQARNDETVQHDEEFLPQGRTEHWQEGKSLQEAMEYLFVYKVGADVTFIVTDQTGKQPHSTLVITTY